ncbi:MAG: hypothetical protein ABI837_20965, partial [Acidobacteriota bacterium]
RLLVSSRLKECDSAVDALRRRQPLGLFDQELSDQYSLTKLPDLAAVRIMAFPERRCADANAALADTLSLWTADPVPGVDDSGGSLALKYFGEWRPEARITAEVQIVPLLIGLFWEVEHSAIYKPSPNLRGVVRSDAVLEKRNAVLAALRAFEDELASAIDSATEAERDELRGSRGDAQNPMLTFAA